MRVLLLTDRVSLRGGADKHLLQVVGVAARSGAEVTVASARRDAEVALPEGVVEARVRGLGARGPGGARLGRLPALLDSADVVHVQNVMSPGALEAAVGTGRAVVTVQDHRVFCPAMGRTLPDGRRCDRPMSELACRDCLRDEGYRARALALTRARRDALRGAQRLLVLSRYMADELAAAGLPGAEVVPPWIEPGPERDEAGTGFVLGGRLVRHKGVLDGLEAWRRAGVDHPLLVAGEGPLGDRLVGARRLGWLGADALGSLLRSARALLFPAFWQEPFGILGLEALALGTPVVAAASGGTGDWTSLGGCLVVPPARPGRMAEAISRLAADPELALRLGRAGRAGVAERFSRGPIEARLLAVYEEVARRSRGWG